MTSKAVFTSYTTHFMIPKYFVSLVYNGYTCLYSLLKTIHVQNQIPWQNYEITL